MHELKELNPTVTTAISPELDVARPRQVDDTDEKDAHVLQRLGVKPQLNVRASRATRTMSSQSGSRHQRLCLSIGMC